MTSVPLGGIADSVPAGLDPEIPDGRLSLVMTLHPTLTS